MRSMAYHKETAEQYYRHCANSVGIAIFSCCNVYSSIVDDTSDEGVFDKKHSVKTVNREIDHIDQVDHLHLLT